MGSIRRLLANCLPSFLAVLIVTILLAGTRSQGTRASSEAGDASDVPHQIECETGVTLRHVLVDGPLALPKDASLAEMSAELYNCGDGNDVPRFVIPKKYHQLVLDSFGMPRFNPRDFGLLRNTGSIKLIYTNGTVELLTWNPRGNGPLVYTYDRIPCERLGVYHAEFGSEGYYLTGLLRCICQRETGNDVGADELFKFFEVNGKFHNVMTNPKILAKIKANNSTGNVTRAKQYVVYELDYEK